MTEKAGKCKNTPGRVVTVGTFDGVHRGHRLVLETLHNYAGERRLEPLVLTLHPHPLMVVAPERAPRLLDPLRRRLELLRKLTPNVDAVEFTESLRHLTVREWMLLMRESYGAQAIVTGYDNTFGSDGMRMSHEEYRRIGKECGLEVVSAPELPGICSSAIRKAVAEGDMRGAARMLGRSFRIEGTVAEGRRLGHALGFPTANVEPAESGLCIPSPGVYAARAVIEDEAIKEGGKIRPTVVNIGNNPTVSDGNPLTIEAHILDYDGDLYGRSLAVDFIDRIRGERKFASLDALKTQIAADAAAARAILKA